MAVDLLTPTTEPHDALIICGPTASGKSAIALQLAQATGGEIINADSRQIYRHMQIGTGWPTPHALASVPHHGYGILDPCERYSAARFVDDASRWIQQILLRRHYPIVVGGTGFYIEALTGSMPLNRPPADDELRARLRREAAFHPGEVLWSWLAALDGTAAAQTKPGDAYRTLRRLEAVLAARRRVDADRPHSSPRIGTTRFSVIELVASRRLLRERIARRVNEMFASGLIAEAQRVRNDFPGAAALSSLGYAEALAYHDGLATRDEAIGQTQRRTVGYAKRQQTWFRHMRNNRRLAADDIDAAIQAVVQIARENLLLT